MAKKPSTARRTKKPVRAMPEGFKAVTPTPSAPPAPRQTTVGEALLAVQAEAPERVLIMYEKGGKSYIAGSHMTSAQALWLAKQAELQTMRVRTIT